MRAPDRPVRILAALAVCAFVLLPLSVIAENADTPPPSEPGFFDAVGRWFSQGADNMRKLNERANENNRAIQEGAAEAQRNATSATKEAFESWSRLPSTRPVSGRERCEAAANGAPDCQSAAVALCRRNGFQTGKSLEFTAAEECPAGARLSSRRAGECPTVTFINKAMCQ